MKRKSYPTSEPLVIARDEVWRTRNGRRVAILAVIAEASQPVIGMMGDDPETWFITGQYTEFGSDADGISGFDLVERVSEAPAMAAIRAADGEGNFAPVNASVEQRAKMAARLLEGTGLWVTNNRANPEFTP